MGPVAFFSGKQPWSSEGAIEGGWNSRIEVVHFFYYTSNLIEVANSALTDYTAEKAAGYTYRVYSQGISTVSSTGYPDPSVTIWTIWKKIADTNGRISTSSIHSTNKLLQYEWVPIKVPPYFNSIQFRLKSSKSIRVLEITQSFLIEVGDLILMGKMWHYF